MWAGGEVEVFWSFSAHSGCIIQLHVQLSLRKAFVFEGEEEEERKCGPQRNKDKMQALCIA